MYYYCTTLDGANGAELYGAQPFANEKEAEYMVDFIHALLSCFAYLFRVGFVQEIGMG